MNCQEAQEQLELLVLDGLDEPTRRRAEAHLAQCRPCQEAHLRLRALVAEVRDSAGRAEPAAPLIAAIRSAGRAEIAARRFGARWARGVAVAAAAVLLAAVGTHWLLQRPRAQAPGPSGTVQAAGPVEQWRHRGAEAEPTSAADGVAVRGGMLCFLQKDKTGAHVAALDARSGQGRWCSNLPSLGYIAADDSRVYCLTLGEEGQLQLAALAAHDGRLLWRQDGGAGRVRALAEGRMPVVPLGRTVCWTNSARVTLFAAAAGDVLWRREIKDEGALSSAGLGRDGLFVAHASALHCLDPATGQELWRQSLGEGSSRLVEPLLSVAERDGQVFVVRPRRGGESELICVDSRSRGVLWQREVPRTQKLLATNTALYLRGSSVEALDRRTGRSLWSWRAAGCGPVTVDDGLAYFVDSGAQARLVALHAQTGRLAWEIAGIRSCHAFIKQGDLGYIKTQDGVIHALALSMR